MTGAVVSRFATRPLRWTTLCLGVMALLFIFGAMPLFASDSVDPSVAANRVFSFAFSEKLFNEVKLEDARAAMKVWMTTVAQAHGIPIDPEPKICANLEEMLQVTKGKTIEGFGVTAEEYWRLGKEIKLDRLAVSVKDGRITEEYVILVHQDSGIQGISDIRGRSLIILENPRMSLATVWLDTFLKQKGMDTTDNLFSSVAHFNKLPLVVLPVFFRKSDACLVARQGFQTMSELNPQVGKKLRALVESPELVPALFAFCPDAVSPYRDQVLIEMNRLSDSLVGRQVLTLFHCEKIEERPISVMNATFELLDIHQRLCPSTDSARSTGDAPLDRSKRNHQ